jgi:hypothetical protein
MAKNEKTTKVKPGSVIAQVTKEAKGNLLNFIKGLGKDVLSNKVKAMVAAAEFVGTEWTKKKGEAVTTALLAFDIKSEKQAKNYINGGRVAIKGQLTEAEILKTKISRLCDFGKRLLEDEATTNIHTIEATIREYESKREQKRKENIDKKDADKSARKAAAQSTADALEEKFDTDDGAPSKERTFAHLSVYFTPIEAAFTKVLGTNAHTGMNRLQKMIVDKAEEMEKKEAEKATAKKASGDK